MRTFRWIFNRAQDTIPPVESGRALLGPVQRLDNASLGVAAYGFAGPGQRAAFSSRSPVDGGGLRSVTPVFVTIEHRTTPVSPHHSASNCSLLRNTEGAEKWHIAHAGNPRLEGVDRMKVITFC